MPTKKKALRKPKSRQTVAPMPKEGPAKRQNAEVSRRLNDLAEQIDIMVPEMTARIAALEHLLLEKQLCSREDLASARDFVRVLED